MKNADKPAYPQDLETFEELIKERNGLSEFTGLTKREAFAMKNMAALLSEGGNVEPELEVYAKIAINAADTLLGILEETA